MIIFFINSDYIFYITIYYKVLQYYKFNLFFSLHVVLGGFYCIILYLFGLLF